jgi:hypothetical protein
MLKLPAPPLAIEMSPAPFKGLALMFPAARILPAIDAEEAARRQAAEAEAIRFRTVSMELTGSKNKNAGRGLLRQ